MVDLMEEAEGKAEHGLSRAESSSRDLLRRFGGGSSPLEQQEAAGGGDSDDIELSLGLSLGGSFGADVRPSAKLVRSSSIASFTMFPREEELVPAVVPLVRTSSLPAEAEEEHRKRKEMQCLKRMEAKRKRSEKSSRVWSAGKEEEECGGGGLGEAVVELAAAVGKVGKFDIELGSCSGFQVGRHLNGWIAPWAGSQDADAAGCFPPVSQSSIGSQGSNSSDFESQQNQGFEDSGFICSTETKNLFTMQSLPSRINHKTIASPSTSLTRGAGGGKEAPSRRNSAGDMEKTMMEEMPCVSTTGEGPNGRRIEGFLYKYREGKEVRIVCVCHGRFLTPAEFVKHAGGRDVPHPLRHIVVNTSPSALLS